MSKAQSSPERRKHRRTAIQESFALFIVIPEKQGMSRIYLRDISQSGLCFRIEDETEFSKGQEFELRFYTSPAFFLSLAAIVVRVQTKDNEIAISFKEPESKAARAIGKLQEFMELAAEA